MSFLRSVFPFSSFLAILSQAPLFFEPFLVLSPLGFSFIDPFPKHW